MTHKALIRRLQISCLGLDPVDPLRLLVDDVVEALREHAMREVQRLGQEIEQEPVKWSDYEPDGGLDPRNTTPPQQEPDEEEYLAKAYRMANELRCHLAIAPAPQRTWVGLTDEEIFEIHKKVDSMQYLTFGKAIEARLKKLNT